MLNDELPCWSVATVGRYWYQPSGWLAQELLAGKTFMTR
jgi:hypothetical protein